MAKSKNKEKDDYEQLAGKLLEMVVAMRQIFTGIEGMCVMKFCEPGEPWCAPDKGKHSCYCPAGVAKEALELSAWVEGRR